MPGRGAGAGQRPAVAAGSMPCTSAAFADLSIGLLRAGAAVRFRARGASMSPLVRDGDVVLVQPVEPRSLRAGDVVLCSSHPGRVVVHRVIRRSIGREGCRFTVQGDRVGQPDGTISQAQVYGRVAAIEREGERIDVERPAMRLLSGLAVLWSRWQMGRSGRFPLLRRLVRRLPGLSRYLA